MFEVEAHKAAILDNKIYHPCRSESDSEKKNPKSRLSKLQSFAKSPEVIDLPDTDTLYESLMSFANLTNTPQLFNQSQTSKSSIRNKYDLLPQSRFFFFPLLSDSLFREDWIERSWSFRLNTVEVYCS